MSEWTFQETKMAQRITGRFPHLAGILPATTGPRLLRHAIPFLVHVVLTCFGLGLTVLFPMSFGPLLALILGGLGELLLFMSSIVGVTSGARWSARMVHIRVIDWSTGRSNGMRYIWRATFLWLVGTGYWFSWLAVASLVDWFGYPSFISYYADRYIAIWTRDPVALADHMNVVPSAAYLTPTYVLLFVYCFVTAILVMLYYSNHDQYGRTIVDRITGTGIITLARGRDSHVESHEAYLEIRTNEPPEQQCYVTPVMMGRRTNWGTPTGNLAASPAQPHTVEHTHQPHHSQQSNQHYPTPAIPQQHAMHQQPNGNHPAPAIHQQPAPFDGAPLSEQAQRSAPGDLDTTVVRPSAATPLQLPLWHITFASQPPIPIKHTLILGRDPNALAQFPNAEIVRLNDHSHTISKTHLVIENAGESLIFHDLQSKNGTTLCAAGGVGERVVESSTVILPYDLTVRIGDVAATITAR